MTDSSLAESYESFSSQDSSSPRAAVSLAFPGGGIRCAAYCHGILETLIENDVPIDNVCGVSGGAYTAAAFVHSLHQRLAADATLSFKAAAAQFFAARQMAKHASYLTNYSTWHSGVIDTLRMLLNLLLWLCLVVVHKLATLAFAVASFDYVFGSTWRSAASGERLFNVAPPLWLLVLFSLAMAVIWIVWLALSAPAHCSAAAHRARNALVMCFTFCLFVLLLLLLVQLYGNWLLASQMSGATDTQVTLGILALVVVALAFLLNTLLCRCGPSPFGLLSLTLYSLVTAFVCVWRVYRDSVLVLGEYTDAKFQLLLLTAGVVLLLPTERLRQRILHLSYRDRLEASFFEGRPACGFDKVRMSELVDARLPRLIAVSVINKWKADVSSEHDFALVGLESGGVLSFCEPHNGPPLWLPRLKVGQAMSLSGAAFALSMGRHTENSVQSALRVLQLELALSVGSFIHFDPRVVSPLGLAATAITSFFGVVLLLFAFELVGGWILVAYIGVAFLLALTGIVAPPRHRTLASLVWHCQWFLSLHTSLDLTAVVPPEQLQTIYLSDGAHADSTGLVPLLAKRCPLIVFCDGGEDPDETFDTMRAAIEYARQQLGCSVQPLGCDDQTHDFESWLRVFRNNPRELVFRFRVIYPDNDSNDNDEHRISLGHDNAHSSQPRRRFSDVHVLKPRHASARALMRDVDVDALYGICSECCHTPCCACWGGCCGSFPHTNTANQFMTASQFEAYAEFGKRMARAWLQQMDDDDQ